MPLLFVSLGPPSPLCWSGRRLWGVGVGKGRALRRRPPPRALCRKRHERRRRAPLFPSSLDSSGTRSSVSGSSRARAWGPRLESADRGGHAISAPSPGREWPGRLGPGRDVTGWAARVRAQENAGDRRLTDPADTHPSSALLTHADVPSLRPTPHSPKERDPFALFGPLTLGP